MRYRFAKTFFIVLLFSFLSFGLADNGFSQTRHKEGTVTKAPWKDRYQRIEIDGVNYTFMPDAVIYERQNNWGDGYTEKPTSYYKIFNGRKVSLQVQGHRIYQLTILP